MFERGGRAGAGLRAARRRPFCCRERCRGAASAPSFQPSRPSFRPLFLSRCSPNRQHTNLTSMQHDQGTKPARPGPQIIAAVHPHTSSRSRRHCRFRCTPRTGAAPCLPPKSTRDPAAHACACSMQRAAAAAACGRPKAVGGLQAGWQRRNACSLHPGRPGARGPPGACTASRASAHNIGHT